jgi:hypothetical protein
VSPVRYHEATLGKCDCCLSSSCHTSPEPVICLPSSARTSFLSSVPALLGNLQQSAMRPSLRGQYRELRDSILEVEDLLERMAPDDVERLTDYARRLAR